MPTCYHAIKVPLDIQRPNESVDRQWVEHRIQIFIRSTLQSLREQTCQDFNIWIHGNPLNRDLHQSFEELRRCRFVYDKGEAITQSIDSDFLLLTRIDSDDLFHKDALAEVRRKVRFSGGMEYLVWRMHYVWDERNKILGSHFHQSPPFITQVFPRKFYKNPQKYVGISWVHHGSLGGRDPGAIELDPYKVCIVKHGINMSLVRAMRKSGATQLPDLLPRRRIEEMHREGLLVSMDEAEIARILADFGVH